MVGITQQTQFLFRIERKAMTQRFLKTLVGTSQLRSRWDGANRMAYTGSICGFAEGTSISTLEEGRQSMAEFHEFIMWCKNLKIKDFTLNSNTWTEEQILYVTVNLTSVESMFCNVTATNISKVKNKVILLIFQVQIYGALFLLIRVSYYSIAHPPSFNMVTHLE